MSRNATSIDTPVLIQKPSSRDANVLDGSEEPDGGTLVCSGNEFNRLFRIDTTDCDGGATAKTAFLELCEAWDRAPDGGISEGSGLPVLIETDPTAERRASQASLSAARATVTDACSPARPTESISNPGSNDMELVEALRRRHDRCATVEDNAACNDFCESLELRILAIFRKIPACRTDAEDLAQDVWTTALVSLARGRFNPARGTLASWIAAIARHLAYRHARRHAIHHEESLSSELSAALVDRSAEESTYAEQEQRLDELHAMIQEFASTLPEDYRRIARMRWLEHATVPEIAAELGVSENCVWGVLSRVGKKFLLLLNRAGFAKLRKNKKKSQNYRKLAGLDDNIYMEH